MVQTSPNKPDKTTRSFGELVERDVLPKVLRRLWRNHRATDPIVDDVKTPNATPRLLAWLGASDDDRDRFPSHWQS